LNLRTLLYSLGIISILLATLAAAGVLSDIWSDFSYSLINNARIDLRENKQDAFLSGNYARGAAVAYYINRGLSWFGDGPSKYYNVFTRRRIVGNTGHIFTFYSEVGLVGWLSSVLIFFLIAFPVRRGVLKISWVGAISFLSIQLLSFTTEVMNDISIVLVYCIMSKRYLVNSESGNHD
jgi:hypothetical protein